MAEPDELAIRRILKLTVAMGLNERETAIALQGYRDGYNAAYGEQ